MGLLNSSQTSSTGTHQNWFRIREQSQNHKDWHCGSGFRRLLKYPLDLVVHELIKLSFSSSSCGGAGTEFVNQVQIQTILQDVFGERYRPLGGQRRRDEQFPKHLILFHPPQNVCFKNLTFPKHAPKEEKSLHDETTKKWKWNRKSWWLISKTNFPGKGSDSLRHTWKRKASFAKSDTGMHCLCILEIDELTLVPHLHGTWFPRFCIFMWRFQLRSQFCWGTTSKDECGATHCSRLNARIKSLTTWTKMNGSKT